MRGATRFFRCRCRPRDISIHAPHAGSDPKKKCNICKSKLFQSTLPMRGATLVTVDFRRYPAISIHAPHAGSDAGTQLALNIYGISIHAPHAGSDPSDVSISFTSCDFNPRSPCGERPLVDSTSILRQFISIHAPHAGSDR